MSNSGGVSDPSANPTVTTVVSTTPRYPLFKVNMSEEAALMVSDTLNSGMITQAKRVEEFEEKLQKYFDYPYIITVNSATSGLTLALRLASITNREDEVISTPLTCFATNAAILANNGSIKWVDVEQTTCNIDIDKVKLAITSKTKALVIVHWGGNPVNMDKVNEVIQYTKNTYGNDLYLVQDCSHAFGAEWRGNKLGTKELAENTNNIAVYSLQAIKHLTTGDGGLIFLPNKELFHRAKLLRWYGIDREERSSLSRTDFRLEADIPEYGYKFHMNDINASIGIANIKTVQNAIDKCRHNARLYDKHFRNFIGIEAINVDYEVSTPSPWIYTVFVKFGLKDSFIQFMKGKGVIVSQVHSRNDKNSCLSAFKTRLPVLDNVEKELVCLPVGWWLNDADVDTIFSFCKEFIDSYSIRIDRVSKDEIHDYCRLIYQINGHESAIVHSDFLHDVYGLYVNGKIVSSVKLFIERKVYDSVAHIEDVVTDSEHRNKGYGKYLIKYLIKNVAFKDQGCYKVVLSCKEELVNFYKSCGMKYSGYAFSVYFND